MHMSYRYLSGGDFVFRYNLFIHTLKIVFFIRRIDYKMKFKKGIFLSALLLSVSLTAGNALKPSNRMDIRGLETSWANGLNNNIRVIKFNDNVKYFRECKKKLNKQSEVKRIVNAYFDEYICKENSKDKAILIKTLSNTDNLEKFMCAGFLWNKDSYLSKYMRGETDSTALGIPKGIAKKLKINLKDFFLYASRKLVHRCISVDIKEGHLQSSLAVKELATYRLAKLLDIDSIIVKTDFVKLLTKHGEKIGVLTDQAIGTEFSKIDNVDLEVDPKFQMALTNLQILDTITNEQDHSPENCFIEITNNRLVGVTAFDNEGGFGLGTNLQRGLCWNRTSALINKNNRINLPHVSKPLAEKILGTTDNNIKNALSDLLSKSQIDSCITRFNRLKSALYDTISENDTFLLENNEWSDDTVSEEISGKYGDTYFVYFLKKLNVITK